MARRRPSTPGIDGILLVDKANGPTSHDVVAKVRRLAGQPRIGHGGTLDPFATGLLVLLLGRATRLAALHQGGSKSYDATFSFGGATTTDDLDGERVGSPTTRATRDRIESLLPRFRGALEQVPPSHSAIRLEGVRAFERARAGKVVTLAPRSIEIKSFEITGWDDSQAEEPLMSARLDVSSGTYIRAIARDLGAAAGSGGHLVALRRVASGSFDVAQAHSIEEISEAVRDGHLARLLLPLDAGIEWMPRVDLSGDAVALARDGASIPDHLCSESAAHLQEGDQVRLMVGDQLAALGRRTETGVRPERVFIAQVPTFAEPRRLVEAE